MVIIHFVAYWLGSRHLYVVFFFGFFKPGQNSLTELERLKKWAVTVVRCFPVYAAEIYSSVCIP